MQDNKETENGIRNAEIKLIEKVSKSHTVQKTKIRTNITFLLLP